MFVRKNLGASVMTRDVACATYPPGSDGWRRWNCGPAPAPAPAPTSAPAPAPTQVPPQLPGSYAPAPRPAPPAPVIVTVDNEAGKRAEREYNARLTAQMVADQAQREKLASDSEAARARQEAEILRAQSNASLVDWEGGGASYSNAGGSGKTSAPVATSNEVYLWLALFAAVGFVATRKKK
jgi:hypothetical protein